MKAILLSALTCSFAWAAPPVVDPADAQKAKALVEKLASPKYREREAAATELLKLGRAATSALTEGRKHPDPEVGSRCEQLLPRARALDLEFRLDRFLKDTAGTQKHELPLLAAYRTTIGDDPAARALFADMLRISGPLVESAEEEPGQLTDRITRRSTDLYMEIFGNGFGGFRGDVVTAKYNPAEVAAIMFLMSRPEYTPPQFDDQFATVYSFEGPFLSKLKDEKAGPAYRKLFFHFILAKLDENVINQTVYMLSNLKIPGSVEVFVKALESNKVTQVYTKAQVIAGIGSVGTKEHKKHIEALLKDEAQVQPFFVGRGGQQGQVKVRDVALAVTIHLSGRSPKDFGFTQWRTYGNGVIPYHQLGFTTDEARAEAFKKWDAAKDSPAPPSVPKKK